MKHELFNSPDCKRLGFVPIFAHSDALRAASVADAARCFGIFGSGDKVQSTTNTQIGASEEATQSTGGGAASREGAAIALSNGGTVANENSLAFGGSNNSNQFGGVKLGGNNSGSITVGYDANTFQNLLQTESNNLTSALNSQSAAGRSQLDAILNSIGGLAENKQTDGQASQNKTVVFVVVSVLALLAWIFYRK